MADFASIRDTKAIKMSTAQDMDYRRALMKITLILGPIFALAYILNFADKVNVGIAKVRMARDFHFTDGDFALGMGIYFLGYSLFNVPSALWIQKSGPRFGLARTMITWGLIAALTTFVSTIYEFSVLRFFLGVAEAGFLPGLALYLQKCYPQQMHGTVMSVMISGALLSGIIVGPFSAFIMQELHGVGHLQDWQWLFFVEGAPTIFLGVLLYCILRNQPSDLSFLSYSEQRALRNAHFIAQELPAQEAGGNFFRTLFSRSVWILSFDMLALNIGVYSIILSLPDLIAKNSTSNLWGIGFLSSSPYVLGLVFLPVIGYLSDLFKSHAGFIFYCGIIGSFSLFISTFFKFNIYLALPCMAIAASLFMAATPLIWSLGGQGDDDRSSSIVVATINTISQLGGFIGPYLVGRSLDLSHDSSYGFRVISVIVFIASTLVIRLHRPRPASI
ncbi:MFS transporter [Gluconacetobacter sp. Hr-1-5]|uniref:MFS transporter n=1 Tax=Gluconacetobacter sp. Hr-1-5 TaxID=3395370 RepID=UPI003B52FBC7